MAKNWFGIDSTGWRRMNAGRKMGHLIREGISNSFDLDDVRNVSLTIKEGHVIIEDDGEQGFGDPDLIFTVFMTGKEDSHLKRGRKGRGLKELIAAADRAKVITPGYTIEFNDEGRTQISNKRTKGTIIDIESTLTTWDKKGTKEAIDYLSKIIPPKNIKFKVNGRENKTPKELATLHGLCLDTTVVINELERTERHNTKVNLYEVPKRKKAYIFEMGIPIQKIDHPFHIDIQQRVPMNDNRDTISEYYQKELSALILDKMIHKMSKNDLKKEWVSQCLTYVNRDTTVSFADKMLGKGSIIKTKNKKANDVAKQHGYEVIDIKSFPCNVFNALNAYIEDSEDVARRIDEERSDEKFSFDQISNDQKKFCRVIEWFGKKLLGKNVTCQMFSRKPDYTGFETQANYCRSSSTVCFNILCENNDFTKPFSPETISTMIHEFAHEFSDEHEQEFQRAVEDLSGKMAYVILHCYHEIHRKFGPISYMPGKTTFIECIDCGVKREIKVQDAFQVKRCKPCQKKRR